MNIIAIAAACLTIIGGMIAFALRSVLRAVASLSDDRFRGFLESSPDAVVIANAAGRVLIVNGQTERLFGYTRSDLIGARVDMLIPERFRKAHGAHLAGYFRAPRSRVMGSGLSLFGRRRDDTEFPLEISLGPVPAADGSFLAMATIRDVSERKKIEGRVDSLTMLAGKADEQLDKLVSAVDWKAQAKAAGWTPPDDSAA